MKLRELIERYKSNGEHLCVSIMMEGEEVDFFRNIDILGDVPLNRPVLEVKLKPYNNVEDVAVVSLD